MIQKTLYIITEEKYPNLTQDDQVLLAAFENIGIKAIPVLWYNFYPPEESYILIRTPWDYSENRQSFETFLNLLDSQKCKVFNSLATLKWNMNKRYLLELQNLDIPVVPTTIVDHYSFNNAEQMLKSGPIVAKPLVGAGGRDTFLIRSSKDIESTKPLLETEVILQPMIESILDEGEYSFLFFGGEFSHALLKTAKAGEFRIQEKHGGQIKSYQPSDEEIQEVRDSLFKVKYPMTYVRVDMVRIEGKLTIMELEAVEPELFFRLHPISAYNLAKIINKAWV